MTKIELEIFTLEDAEESINLGEVKCAAKALRRLNEPIFDVEEAVELINIGEERMVLKKINAMKSNLIKQLL